MAAPSRWLSRQAQLTAGIGFLNHLLSPHTRQVTWSSFSDNDSHNNVTMLKFIGEPVVCQTLCSLHILLHFALGFLSCGSTFWAGWVFLCEGWGWRVVLCILGRFETSLASTSQMSAHIPPPLVIAEAISRHG